MNHGDLTRLATLAAMKRDADLQGLSAIAARMATIQAEIDRVRAEARLRAGSAELDPSRMSGSDVMWERWIAGVLVRLQRQMADLAVAREAYLQRARQSFGRAEALRTLEERQDRDKKR